MKINLLEHPEFIHGAAELILADGAVYPQRFSKSLTWSPSSEMLNVCSAGIRLHCRTDAQHLAFKFRLGARSWEFGRGEFDLFIDGRGVSTFTPLPPWDENQLFEFNWHLPAGRHEVLLYFPIYSKTGVIELEFGGATSVDPVDVAPRKILFLGDSITQGYAATSSQCYAARLARIFQAEYLNLSVGGGKMPRPLPSAIAREKFELAVVAFGVNDASTSRDVAEFRAAVAEILQNFTADPSHKIAMIQPVYWPSGAQKPVEKLLQQFREIIAAEARGYAEQVLVVNGLELIPHEEQFFADGLHPNAAGMRVYAANLSGKIADWLQWQRDEDEL